MILAEAISSLLWVLLGATIVGALLIIIRAISRADDEPVQMPSSPNAESDASGSRLSGRLASLEVQLHDFVRQTEARLETRALQLDQLVAEADRQISRLTDLLKSAAGRNDARGPDAARYSSRTTETSEAVQSTKSGPGDQMVFHLHDAGYSVAEIAHIIGRSPDEVSSLLRAA